MYGVQKYIQYSKRFVNVIPDLTGTAIEYQVRQNKVISRARQRGKCTGKLHTPYGSVQGNGNTVDLEYQIEQEFNDAGKIKRFVVHYNLPKFMNPLSSR